ncbi:MAG: VOC family protein [Planctomycetota bacterium]
MQALGRIYETVLYAPDLDATAKFYQSILGLKLLSQTELMLVFAVGKNYLLVFDPKKSSTEGRLVPSHGCSGEGHLAFTVEADELSGWREKLALANIEIEKEVEWSEGLRGRSIYFRDPAGNSIELAPPILWSYLHGDEN